MEYQLVMTTAADESEAAALARSLVEAGLAACVQMQPIRSVYRWKGEFREDSEWRLVAKIMADRYPEVERHIRERHSYELPEIVSVRIESGSPDYLRWLQGE
jgi:periplasmic divalent cation tolerance protein